MGKKNRKNIFYFLSLEGGGVKGAQQMSNFFVTARGGQRRVLGKIVKLKAKCPMIKGQAYNKIQLAPTHPPP